MQILVRVPTALRTTRDIIEVIDTLDLEGNMTIRLDEGQVPTRILDLWQFDDLAKLDVHAKNSTSIGFGKYFR